MTDGRPKAGDAALGHWRRPFTNLAIFCRQRGEQKPMKPALGAERKIWAVRDGLCRSRFRRSLEGYILSKARMDWEGGSLENLNKGRLLNKNRFARLNRSR